MKPVERAIEKMGGIPQLASALGLHRATIWGWTRIPAERVLDVERATGISRHDLRPDLYPRDGVASAA